MESVTMNKSEIREVAKLVLLHKHGLTQSVALGLSALIRAARTNKSRSALLEYAELLGVKSHPEFTI
jgi:hypothetical protein